LVRSGDAIRPLRTGEAVPVLLALLTTKSLAERVGRTSNTATATVATLARRSRARADKAEPCYVATMSSLAPGAEDLTVYPVEERVGEDILQRWIVELLRPLVERWLRQVGEQAFVGADQFIYFQQHNPLRRVSPDVYVLPGVAPDTHVRSWKVWETGIRPSFALEVVSTNWEKDYCQVPLDHDELGTRELVIFDPNFEARREGVRWQRYGRDASGRLRLVERTDNRAVQSTVLGCALRAVGVGQELRLRLAESRDSLVLFPTAEEAERQAKEAERQAKEAERQANEELKARIAELEARLAKYEK
jgi:hypothetical protein